MTHRELTELLAYRNGEITPSQRATLEADPDLAAKLARLNNLAQALRSLPEQPPGPALWSRIQAGLRIRDRRALRHPHHWRVLAAVFAVVALAGVLLIDRSERMPATAVAQLIDTSQQLERSWADRPRYTSNATDVRRALQYRIASVDSALNHMSAEGQANTKDALVLWEKRVMLLRSLLDAEHDERAHYIAL